jgi:uncharacterized protein with GYD domain
MPTYISLTSFTEQGIKNFRDTVRRAEDARGLIQQHGGQLRQIFWTLGHYDLVTVADFPDDETATAVMARPARRPEPCSGNPPAPGSGCR